MHYWTLKQRCTEAGLHGLAAKQATSLLRYIGIIPADTAFYEAGTAEQALLLVTVHCIKVFTSLPRYVGRSNADKLVLNLLRTQPYTYMLTVELTQCGCSSVAFWRACAENVYGRQWCV